MFELKVPHLETAIQGPLQGVEKHLISRHVEIETWFQQQWKISRPPVYGSVDLRNAGIKLAPVDTNLFPAGFNNINRDFLPLCIQAMQAALAEACPAAKQLLIIPENHTRNIFYFESLAMLQEILLGAGYDVRIGSMHESVASQQAHELPSGRTIKIEPLIRQGNKVGVSDFFPCCILLNNDLSDGIPPFLENISQQVMPSMKLGWSNRLKSEHFCFYEKVTTEFSEAFNLDPWLIAPYFDQCPDVNFMQKEGQQCLTARAEALLKRIRKKYLEYNIDRDPFLVIKADQGTYGMAVMMIKDVKEIAALNRKQRTRMSTLKGGSQVTKAIIQEGVYSIETVGEGHSVAEPVIYTIGRSVVGGFYRVHADRRSDENLNAPGMSFQPFKFSNTEVIEGENRFYAYSVIARLAVLAAAREMEAFK